MIIRIDYPQSGVRLDLWGGTSGTFAGLDQFDRIIDQRWQNNTASTPADIDRYQYGYDPDSNRLYKANVVGTPVVSGGLDEHYAYDPLNRLTQMQRGVLNSAKTGITGTPTREMDWTLDSTGNWPQYVTLTGGTTDLNQSRTSNPVNEITALSESTGPAWVTPAYDAAGNMTTMPQVADPTQGFTAAYDAWNRMVSISASGTTVAQYRYDGRNRRAVKLTYSGGSLSETRHFYFTDMWQDIEERVGTSTSMDKQYAWGVRYVDELVCRDDATPRRLYACQDANFNLTAITDTSGNVQERYRFDPYGNRTIMNASWATIASSAYDWVVGHQGLMHDVESGLAYNRNRMLHVQLGLFGTRDPLEFAAGLNLYQYVNSSPGNLTDSSGLLFGQSLSFQTTQEPIPDDCGSMQAGWQIWWKLSKPSAWTGYIVQHVELNGSAADCAGNSIDISALQHTFGYWESWTVPGNSKSTNSARLGYTYDDMFLLEGLNGAQGPFGDCTKGQVTLSGTAVYFEGYRLSPKFHVYQNSPSGDLPMTRQNPYPYAAPLQGATPSVLHTMTLSWDCCSMDKRTTITHN